LRTFKDKTVFFMKKKHFNLLQYIKDKKLAIDILNNTTLDEELDMLRKGYKPPTLFRKELTERRKPLKKRIKN